jgi:hypothetical protein
MIAMEFVCLRNDHRLRIFDTRVPRRILGCKRDLVIGGWRKLHNEELHNLCSLQSITDLRFSWW